MRIKALIALFTIALIAAQASPARKRENGAVPMVDKKIRVLVLINAGEPDPFWEITTDSDLATLKKSLDKLHSAKEPVWPSLGWRGFQLVNEGVAGLPENIQVFEGIIRIRDGNKTSYFRDEHGLEKWLEKQAKVHNIRLG